MSSLQRAARKTLINFANQRKGSFNLVDGDTSQFMGPTFEECSENEEEERLRQDSIMMNLGGQIGQHYDSFFDDWDFEDIAERMDEKAQARLMSQMIKIRQQASAAQMNVMSLGLGSPWT